jgi:chromosome segregation protein
MRLTKIKLAGFKSFVDPTQVSFPSNLTGVVGPNGCGKSNVIDAVRWVMGELSAKYLRGDNMSDVIFNGSAARKPVGAASVELVFDNADGKIGGAYASYNEVSLRRQVARDGSSGYYINGARCRRKDITNLFLGTGLGSRSYAIIEQGTISRIIEAKAEDMRAFVEEAAGISRYKERRKETESRIADTRENLERLQDVRDEVEKQIRHLQRQAAVARRYRAMKEDELRLTAELLVLRLRELDSGAQVHDSATRARELEMQSALADQRAAEAAIETARAQHVTTSERVSCAQGRYYEVGAEISRLEQTIQHIRELKERQRADLEQARATLAELGSHIGRDERQLIELGAEIARATPQLESAESAERAAAQTLESAERELAAWQERWEELHRELGSAERTAQVERARIEQLENQLRRARGQLERLALESESLAAQQSVAALPELTAQESQARLASEALAEQLRLALERVQRERMAQHEAEHRLEAARAGREAARAERTSLEAVQKAALSASAGQGTEWLAASGLAGHARAAERLEVESGWELAVETALGDYLEAVCIERLDELVGPLERLANGSIALIEAAGAAPGAVTAAKAPPAPAAPDAPRSLAGRVCGPEAVLARLAGVLTAESLAEALERRRSLGPGQSLITRGGEWLGRDWLRVSRGVDQHLGVIEREQRLKGLRSAVEAAESAVAEAQARLALAREGLARAEGDRDRAQSGIQAAHRRHAEVTGQLEAARARARETALRRERIEGESAEIAREIEATDGSLRRAHEALGQGIAAAGVLEGRREELEGERERRRQALASARAEAQRAQIHARDLLIRIESRRSTEATVRVSVARMSEQRGQLTRRREELETELADGDAPIREHEARLDEALGRRLSTEEQLAAARGALEEADATLRALDEQRVLAERRVGETREVMEAARLAAQENRVRREALAEQFAETRLELGQVQQGLPAEAAIGDWEQRLADTRADIEKLGQVNLAAIDELEQQSERKAYLDRQFTDLTSALATLEEAMRRIDKETRNRFEETFERINTGLKEKFPRLFGGGHAYLELVGEDVLAAGVAVMARPPGKKNSSIHQLSGGEKALMAVALVFSIFDLNPAPFCLLDEVDAPLDEHNVGRFCDIVREMSARVQFIFITHNKATMELSSQLLGVTMHEPGVSRLVAVDVDEAVRLAAV